MSDPRSSDDASASAGSTGGPHTKRALPFRTQRRVEFCETDAAGIAHFAVFFTYMEQAEHALLRQLGLSVVLPDKRGTISWPRVNATCQYEGSVAFEQILDIEVCLERLGRRSVTYAFDFMLDSRRVARGTLTSVCCLIQHGQPPQSMDIPEWISAKLRSFQEQVELTAT